jgi:N-acyl-D-amino-acid deacylase
MRISKRWATLVLMAVAVSLLTVCFTGVAGAKKMHKCQKASCATLVLVNGDVYTMDPDQPDATCVAIRGSRILAVGDYDDVRRYIHKGYTRVRNVRGKVISPGFIDPHMHLRGIEGAESYARQGVTTIVTGNCGYSPTTTWVAPDIAKFITDTNKTGFPVNIATYIGANTLRHAVGVPDAYTAATPAQIEQMCVLADKAMRDGALGVSIGTEYEPGQSYAEIEALAKVAAKYKGHVAAHVRTLGPDGPFTCVDSINEAIKAGKVAGCSVQISHIGSMATNIMAPSLKAIADARADGVDVTADCYPYTAWSAGIKTALFDPGWQQLYRCTYSDIEVVSGPYAGRRCDEALFNLLRSLPEETQVAVDAIPYKDVVAAYQSPFVMVGSDGGIKYDPSARDYVGHPRGAGSFPRVLGKMVREEGVLTLEQALYKMTVMPAWRLQLTKKGMLKSGFSADIVVFDKDTIIDTAKFGPGVCNTAPRGIERVYVQGKLAVLGTQYLGTMSGQAVAHQELAQPPLPVPQYSTF